MKFKEYINESKELRKYFDNYIENMFDNQEDLPSERSYNSSIYDDENWKDKSLQQRWKSFVDHARKGAYDYTRDELDELPKAILKMNPSASDKKLFMKRQKEI